ncbi:DUF4250 domain-containing protein [Acholeplasma vituli]|uniref:DUF4250 domain-containing protein n=1 Tax=Paracholeplasma vituli TaxID=69473 RepID=A0ABT2PT18_9MOLU|nr:DUF4250 domain-containing protein [Paracholeplasma vituli]MCU0104098.1 DUF4250 domain-containing protein [Paracholeplasma vituli]
MNITMDPILLISILNTKLRNEYPTLYDLCDDLDINQADLEHILGKNSYVYDEKLNQIKKGLKVKSTW